MEGGRLEDGTPWVAIGGDEPEAKEFIVHCACEECGEQHYFNLWDLLAEKEITCEHCGHVSKAKVRRY